jgi:hypothetical protein
MSQLQPAVIFAITRGLDAEAIARQFDNEGLDLLFVRNDGEFRAALDHAGAFLVFLGQEFEGDGLTILRSYLPQTTLLWIYVTPENLTTQKRSHLFQTGVSDVLPAPVRPAEFRFRSKAALGKFLKSHDLPPEVTLPDGFFRRGEGDSARRNERAEAPLPMADRQGPDPLDLSRLNKPSADGEVLTGMTRVESEANSLLGGHRGGPDPTNFQSQVAKAGPRPGMPLVRKASTTAEILDEIRRKAVLLQTGRAWDPSVWARPRNFGAVAPASMEEMTRDIRELFRHTNAVLGSRKIVLFSLLPTRLGVERGEGVFVLVSSDARPLTNAEIRRTLLPQLEVIREKKLPFYVDTRMPDTIDGLARPPEFLIEGAGETMSAVVPIMQETEVALALLIQFDRGYHEGLRELLDQSVSFLGEPRRQYGWLDFLGRVYRRREA